MRRLSQRHREVLVLHWVAELSLEEMATQLGEERGCRRPSSPTATGRVAVMATATGKVVRTLAGPQSTEPVGYGGGDHPRRSTVFFNVAARRAAGNGGSTWCRWKAPAAASGITTGQVSLSPDGRQVAVPAVLALDPLGVRVLDVAGTDTFNDGRLIQAPDARCQLTAADFQPGTGRLAAFERCLDGPPPISAW